MVRPISALRYSSSRYPGFGLNPSSGYEPPEPPAAPTAPTAPGGEGGELRPVSEREGRGPDDNDGRDDDFSVPEWSGSFADWAQTVTPFLGGPLSMVVALGKQVYDAETATPTQETSVSAQYGGGPGYGDPDRSEIGAPSVGAQYGGGPGYGDPDRSEGGDAGVGGGGASGPDPSGADPQGPAGGGSGSSADAPGNAGAGGSNTGGGAPGNMGGGEGMGGGGSTGGGCVVTTALNDMGAWTDTEKRVAVDWCRRTHHDGSRRGRAWVRGYHVWGGIVAKAARRSPLFRRFVRYTTSRFVDHTTGRDCNAVGFVVHALIVTPFSYVIGVLCNKYPRT